VDEVAKFEAGNSSQTNFATIRHAAIEDVDDCWTWNEQQRN
jgi:hypothetical protein